MTTHDARTTPNLTGAGPAGHAFDWAVVALSGLMLLGVHLDAWAHHRYALETFFTPWHGLLYSGYGLLAVLLAGRAVRGGGLRPRAMPAGYGWSLVGAGLFALGGISDLVWHTLFGIEVNVEALLSPPHLLLALGAGLMVTGPMRAALIRGETRRSGPALMSLVMFFTAYANPLVEAGEGQGGLGPALGVAGVLVQSALLTGVVLFGVRHFQLPRFGLTLLVTLSAALMLLPHLDYAQLPPLVIGGLLLDAWRAGLRWAAARRGAFRAFAAFVPPSVFALAVAALAHAGTLPWSWTLASGAAALAALVGWLLSFAFLPERLEEHA